MTISKTKIIELTEPRGVNLNQVIVRRDAVSYFTHWTSTDGMKYGRLHLLDSHSIYVEAKEIQRVRDWLYQEM